MHNASLIRTVPKSLNIIPAKTYGLQRVFNLASSYRFDKHQQAPVCVLNAEPTDPGVVMNGTCFEMNAASLHDLLDREKGYDFREIDACHYHNDNDQFKAYYFTAASFKPYRYLSESTEQRHYLNLCLNGSAVFGKQFVADFKKSTSFWGLEAEVERDAIWQGEF